MKEIKTLTEAIRHFSSEQTCIDTVAQMRWPDGVPVCPHCGVVENGRKHYWLKTQRRWKCYSCRQQFSVKVGTIFEDSALKLDVWLIALWMLTNCKNGVSSYELARATGIAQKSAWFVLQRLRYTLQATDPRPMGSPGPVEVDECFLGPKPKNMHASRRAKLQLAENGNVLKTPVMGMVDRSTREVRAMVIPNVKRETLQTQILKHCGFATKVYTDSAIGYQGLDATRFIHKTVNHAEEYVASGGVSTQAIENFWSCLKRTLQGTYVAVEPFHLDLYLSEQIFRFNNRLGKHDGQRFSKALAMVNGKRLTWNRLTGKEEASS
jgi:transposase-like protein